MQSNSDTTLLLGPNASLTVRQAWVAFGLMAAVALFIALGMTFFGFWPVLPFAGLEVAALGAALWVSMRRNRYRELLKFEAGRVNISFGEVGVGVAAAIDWPRAWTRAALLPGPNRLAPTVLSLNSYGQSVTIGRCLTDAERAELFARIKQLLPPVWRMAIPQASGSTSPASGIPKES